jgi:hydrogenase maturation protein HypF
LLRVVFEITGIVQGVGFRPTVARLARSSGLRGTVHNERCNVIVDAFGSPESLNEFETLIQQNAPAAARIDNLKRIESALARIAPEGFTIRESAIDSTETFQANIIPDLATCPECLDELFTPENRRYLYPFINCTLCGPRLSIIEAMPWDRERTSMKTFIMCDNCRREFEDSNNRRYHAQPNACPDCGPHVEYMDSSGNTPARHGAAVDAAIDTLLSGGIVALKGIGGFQLLADATNPKTVRQLRRRKLRPEKPFALMMQDIQTVQNHCFVSSGERALLTGPAAPIVLLKQKTVRLLPDTIAGNTGRLGVMLPYSPIHHIIMRRFGRPVIATSGNRSNEPICISTNDALLNLSDVADGFLTNNRPIVRPLDDSVVHVILGKQQVIRAARGYTPMTFRMPSSDKTMVALGAHEKNTIAFQHNRIAVLCAHIGDLDTAPALENLSRSITDMQNLLDVSPQSVICDYHPGYGSRTIADTLPAPKLFAYHHIAHAAACMIEHAVEPPFTAIVWDGTGLGPDGHLAGGEFFRFDGSDWQHKGALEPFPLPGGEMAIKQPWRTALSLLFQAFGTDFLKWFSVTDTPRFERLRPFVERHGGHLLELLQKKINTPQTTSIGRLFDGIAAICGVCPETTFEAQAPMLLEALCETDATGTGRYLFRLETNPSGAFTVGWTDLIQDIFCDIGNGMTAETVSVEFHRALVKLIVEAAVQMAEKKVLLSGGCFQNRVLTRNAVLELEKQGFEVYRHSRVPTNDAGISLGQLIACNMP